MESIEAEMVKYGGKEFHKDIQALVQKKIWKTCYRGKALLGSVHKILAKILTKRLTDSV